MMGQWLAFSPKIAYLSRVGGAADDFGGNLMSWTYRQHDGALLRNDRSIATGYSGHGAGKNNPDLQDDAGIGPIPRGFWHMTGLESGGPTGPFTIILDPEPGTVTFGRTLFRIHGDSKAHPGSASHGCVILGPQVRHDIWNSGDHLLDVVA